MLLMLLLGNRIFGTNEAMKVIHQAESGFRYCHKADGLEGVLKEVSADT
jgi:hypothetical protein